MAPARRSWQCPTPAGAGDFHSSLPGFAPTHTHAFPALADRLGVGEVGIKDESTRLGTGAFKILGASWAASRAVAASLGISADELAELGLAGLRHRVDVAESRPSLVTATDGNHGRAVAITAGWLGITARVFTPAGVPAPALARIRDAGAEVEELAVGYDEAVRAAAGHADATGALLIQDTAWDGYTDVPTWIVDGYETLFAELDDQAPEPDLVVVPTGVGSVLQAALAHYRSGTRRPAVLCVEPTTADCVLASLHAGRRTTVPTDTPTVMNGLNCGSVSTLAWPVIAAGLDAAVAITDAEATDAVEALRSLGQVTGPNGAAALAGAEACLTGPGSDERRRALGLGDGARVVLLNTEGFEA